MGFCERESLEAGSAAGWMKFCESKSLEVGSAVG